MKLICFLSLFCLFATVSPDLILLEKYKKEENIEVNYIAFESKKFKDDKKMHFKIKSWEENYHANNDTVIYFYVNDYDDYDSSQTVNHTISFENTIKWKEDVFTDDYYKTSYFTIKKQKSEYKGKNGNGNGDYLIMEFPIKSGKKITVENTRTNEGLYFWIVIIVVASVILISTIVVLIVCCCCCCNRGNTQVIPSASPSVVAAIYPIQNNPSNQVPESKSEMYAVKKNQNQLNSNYTGY